MFLFIVWKFVRNKLFGWIRYRYGRAQTQYTMADQNTYASMHRALPPPFFSIVDRFDVIILVNLFKMPICYKLKQL